MEILNQLLSNQADYLNALRHAQQMSAASPPNSGNEPKFKFNGKMIVGLLAGAVIVYIGYHVYRRLTSDPLYNED